MASPLYLANHRLRRDQDFYNTLELRRLKLTQKLAQLDDTMERLRKQIAEDKTWLNRE